MFSLGQPSSSFNGLYMFTYNYIPTCAVYCWLTPPIYCWITRKTIAFPWFPAAPAACSSVWKPLIFVSTWAGNDGNLNLFPRGIMMNYDYIDLPSQSKSSKSSKSSNSSISLGWKHAYFAAHQWSPQFVPNSASSVPRCWKITLFTEFPMGLFYMGCVQRWVYKPSIYHHFIGKVCFLTIKKWERAPSRAENVSSCPHLAPGWISIYLEKRFAKKLQAFHWLLWGFSMFWDNPLVFSIENLGA